MRRRLFLLALLVVAASSCTGFTARPLLDHRTGMDEVRFEMSTATFDLICDSCRVEYGREDTMNRSVAEGGWRGTVALGNLQMGQRVRVIMRVQPVGDARILEAKITVNDEVVASSKDKKPGQSINLSARVGPSR